MWTDCRLRVACKSCSAVARVRQYHPQGLNRWYRLLLAEMAQERSSRPQPSQPPRCQTQDVQVRQETSGTSRPTALEENLC